MRETKRMIKKDRPRRPRPRPRPRGRDRGREGRIEDGDGKKKKKKKKKVIITASVFRRVSRGSIIRHVSDDNPGCHRGGGHACMGLPARGRGMVMNRAVCHGRVDP